MPPGMNPMQTPGVNPLQGPPALNPLQAQKMAAAPPPPPPPATSLAAGGVMSQMSSAEPAETSAGSTGGNTLEDKKDKSIFIRKYPEGVGHDQSKPTVKCCYTHIFKYRSSLWVHEKLNLC